MVDLFHLLLMFALGGIVEFLGKAVSAPINAIGRTTGIKISPKGVKVGAPSFNIGDLATIATGFAPGGNLGAFSLGNIGKSTVGSFANNLAQGSGLGALMNPSKANTGDFMNLFRTMQQSGGGGMARPASGGIGGFNTGAQGLFQQMLAHNQEAQGYRRRAANELDPNNGQDWLNRLYGANMSAADAAGRRNEQALNQRGYLGQSLGAMLGARNEGQRGVHQAAQQMSSPSYRSQAYATMAELLANPQLAQIAGMISDDNFRNRQLSTQVQQYQDQIDAATPTFWESILGYGAPVLAAGVQSGWFDNLFGGGGGGQSPAPAPGNPAPARQPVAGGGGYSNLYRGSGPTSPARY